MNAQTNTGYGPQSESKGGVSIGVLFAMPTSGSFIMANRIEYKNGQLINGIAFIKEVSRKRKAHRRALFICPHCEKEFETDIICVRTKNTKSCGCKKGLHKHGLTHTPIWYLHNDMIQRCYNPKHNSYHNYGGRDIGVCDEWRNNIQTFMNYIIKLPRALEEGYSIDRINNDGNYEPGNIRWATQHIQSANQKVRCDNKTGIKGVFFDKESNRFNANIAVNKKRYYLGYFDYKEDALKARNDFIIKNELWEYKIQKM